MKGLDIGTSYLCVATEKDSKVVYRNERNAFFQLNPVSKINESMIKNSLTKSKIKWVQEDDGSILVIGRDAISEANRRYEQALRPLKRGVISPKEQYAKPILRFVLKELLGDPEAEEKVAYSVPAQPVDCPSEDFDIGFHEDFFGSMLKSFGYDAFSIKEGEAIAYSELLDSGLNGMVCGFGAGMVQVCLISAGDPILNISTIHSGDWIDHMAALATGQSDTIVQTEKESGLDLFNPQSEIQEALAIYYGRQINYTITQIVSKLNKTQIPRFDKPIEIVLSGGTSLPKGFKKKFEEFFKDSKFPISYEKIRYASDQLNCVAHGALLAAQL